jgi:hypothetical protein
MGLRPTQGDEKRVHHRIVVSTEASRGPQQLRCWGGKRSGEICGSRSLAPPFSTERSEAEGPTVVRKLATTAYSARFGKFAHK